MVMVKREVITFKLASHECGVCGKSYSSKYQVNRHKKNQHVEQKTQSFNCTVCSAKFRLERSMNLHLANIHEKRRDFLCHLCSAAFFRMYDLKCHVQSQHDDTPMSAKCSICDKGFESKSPLVSHLSEAHVVVHETGRKRFECNGCGLKFVTEVTLTKHLMFAHQGLEKTNAKKSFKCEICGKSYRRRKPLLAHARSHPGEQTRIEPQPSGKEEPQLPEGRDTAVKVEPDVHKKTPAEASPEWCQPCQLTFSKRWSYYRHMRLKHGLIIKCQACQKIFASTMKLQWHEKKVHGSNPPPPIPLMPEPQDQRI